MAERDTLQVLTTIFDAQDQALLDAFKRIEKQSADAIKSLRAIATEGRDIFDSFGSATANATQEQQKATKSTREAVKANDELSDTIKDLRNQVATQRNLWAGRVTDDEKFKESTAALREELLKLVEAGNLTNEQMKQATQGIAYSQRGLDSAAKVASRGGLAWTAQIAIANQFGQELRNLGPAGNAASLALQAFQQQLGSAGSASQDLLGKTQLLAAGIGVALVGAVTSATAAITKLASDSAAWAGDLLNASERLNTTAESLQALRFAAQNASVSTSSLESSLQSLTRRAASAAEGSGPAADAYKRLGISVTDAAGMLKSSDVLLGEIADAFNALEDPAQRSALAFQLMNRTGVALLPMLTEGSVGLSQMAQEADRLSLVMSTADLKALDSFGSELGIVRDQFAMLGRAAAADFLPILRNDVVPFIQNEVLPAVRGFAGTLEELAGFLGRSEGSLTTWVTHVAKWSGAAVLATAAVRGLTTAVTAFGVAVNTALPIARIATVALSALALVVTKVAKAQSEARRAVEELKEAIEAIPSVAGTAATGLEQLQSATGKEGLKGAVETLASTLEGDAKNAFVALASQAIASGGDIETVGRSISRIFASVRQEAIETRVAATRELAETAAAAHSVIAASHSRAQADLAQIEQWQADRERLQQQLAPYKAIDVTQQARGIQDHVKSLESQIRRLDDSIQSAAARTGNIAEKYAQSSGELNQAQTRYSMALADQAINAQLLNGELEDAVSLFDGLSASVADGADAAEATSSALNEVGLSINSINEAIRDLTEQRDAVTDDNLRDALTAEIARLEEQKRAMLGMAEGTAKAAAKSGELEAALGSLAWAEKNLADAQERLNKSAPEGWDAARADVEAWQNTVDEMRKAVESLDAPLEAATTWVTRLGRELDSGFKSSIQVSGLLAPAIERIKSEMRELSAAGEHTSKEMEILADQLKILEGLEGRIQLPEVKLQPRPDEGETSTQWLDDLRRAVKAASDAFSDDLMFRLGTLHESVDTNAERVQFLTKELTDLWNQGRENTDVFRQYAAELKWLNDEMEHAERITAKHGQALFDNLRPIVKGAPLLGEYADLYHRVADATAAAVNPIQALRDEIEAIGGKLPTFLQGPLTLLLEQLDEFEENEALKKLGENADAARERVEALLTESSDAFGKLITELEKMSEKGDLASDVVDELVASLRDAQATAADSKAADEFEKLTTTFQQLTGTGPTQVQALRAELVLLTAAGGEFAEQARRMLGGLDNLAATQFTDLLNEIQAIGAQADPFQNMTDSIRTLKEQGELTTAQIEQLMRALGDRKAELAAKSFNEMAREISRMNAEPDRFRDMAESIRKAGEDANWTTNEVDKLLTLLAEQQSIDLAKQLEDAKEAVEALSGRGATEFDTLRIVIETVRDSMIALGEDTKDVDALLEQLSAAEKTSDLVDQLGQVRDALHQIGSAAGGEFGAVLTGLGDMVDIAQKFASGDIAGAAVDVLSEIVSGISEVINANAQWRESLDQLANRYKSLSREAVEAITVSRREAIKLFGLIPIGSRKVVDEQATQEGMAWATSFVGAVENALKGTDLTADFQFGLDTMIQEELIRGFTQGTAMTEAVKGIVEVFREAWEEEDPGLRDALIMSAREGYEGLQDEMEDFWEFLQENFPDLYDLGRSGGGDFTSGFTSALTGMDFTRDFNLGLDKLIQQEMIDGFLAGDDVKAAMKAAREAFAEGDWEEGRAHLELLRDSGEAFWRQMQEQFPDLYEELRAGDLANALQASADAAKQLSLEVSRSAVARAFETGTASLAEYRDMLAATARAEAELAREQAHRDLEERRRSALAGLDGQERADAAAVFDREAAAIDARFSESVADAEHEAVNAIKSILGVTTDGLAGSLRSAFDTSSFTEFTAAFGDSMRDTVRGGLIAGFLESESMKPLLVELGNMISDAIVDGTFDAATKAAIGMQVDLITETSEEFFKWLEELGYGFKDLSLDTTKLSDTVQSASESLLNVPSLFKFTQATWDAAPVQPGWASPSTYGAAAAPGETNIYVTVSGDVYGIDDFDQRVQDNARRGQEQANLATAGLGR